MPHHSQVFLTLPSNINFKANFSNYQGMPHLPIVCLKFPVKSDRLKVLHTFSRYASPSLNMLYRPNGMYQIPKVCIKLQGYDSPSQVCLTFPNMPTLPNYSYPYLVTSTSKQIFQITKLCLNFPW